jgi:hypothetical protein
MNRIAANRCLPVVATLFLAWGCDDAKCDFGDKWCEDNVVHYCDESYDCTVLHCTETSSDRKETDCSELGAFCQAFEDDPGAKAAFCSVTDHPCPTGMLSLCVGDVLAVCHPTYDYPEWVVDCREDLNQACVQRGPDANCE